MKSKIIFENADKLIDNHELDCITIDQIDVKTPSNSFVNDDLIFITDIWSFPFESWSDLWNNKIVICHISDKENSSKLEEVFQKIIFEDKSEIDFFTYSDPFYYDLLRRNNIHDSKIQKIIGFSANQLLSVVNKVAEFFSNTHYFRNIPNSEIKRFYKVLNKRINIALKLMENDQILLEQKFNLLYSSDKNFVNIVSKTSETVGQIEDNLKQNSALDVMILNDLEFNLLMKSIDFINYRIKNKFLNIEYLDSIHSKFSHSILARLVVLKNFSY